MIHKNTQVQNVKRRRLIKRRMAKPKHKPRDARAIWGCETPLSKHIVLQKSQDKRKTFLKPVIKSGFELWDKLHHGKGEGRMSS